MKINGYSLPAGDSLLLSKALLLGYGLFFVGFFLLPKEVENYHQGFYYMGLALVGLILLPKSFQLLRYNTVFWMLVIYCSYMVSSTLWSESFGTDPEAVKRSIKILQRTLYIIAFFLLTAVLRELHPVGFDNMLKVVCIAAGVSSIVTLVLWYSTHPFPDSRVWGFSLVRWTIFAAYSFGVFAVLSVYFLFRTSRPWMRWALGFSFAALFSYVWLSQSRAALGATVIGVIVVSLGSRFRHTAVVLLVVVAVVTVTTLMFVPDASDLLFSRGLSFRPQIWSAYIERAASALVVGEGYLSDPRTFVYAPPLVGLVPDAHSAYFGTLRDGGVIGLLLLLATFAAALLRGAKSAWRNGNYLSLALGLEFVAFLATDSDRLIARTGGQWIFLWLPLAIIMTDPLGAGKKETRALIVERKSGAPSTG